MWLYGARTGDYCFSRTFPHSNDSGVMRRMLDEEGLESAGEGLNVAPVFEAVSYTHLTLPTILRV